MAHVLADSTRSIRRVGSRFLTRLATHSDLVARLHSFLRLRWSGRKDPIVVYQMGKVGSTTLLASLDASAPVTSRYSIYHAHRLTPEGLEQIEQLRAEARSRLRNSLSRRRLRSEDIWSARWLSKRVRDSRSRHRWRVVTLVREPIARNISSFFQNLETRLYYDYDSRLRYDSLDAVAAEVTRLFLENYLEDRAIERIDLNPLTWFDSELQKVFGLDVYATEFDKARGYQIYDGERARLLLMRLEDLDRIHGEALKEFLDVESFTLVKANTGRAKAYSELYKTFLDNLVLPAEYVDELYASRYARHFYTEQEIQTFRGRWKARRSLARAPSDRPA